MLTPDIIGTGAALLFVAAIIGGGLYAAQKTAEARRKRNTAEALEAFRNTEAGTLILAFSREADPHTLILTTTPTDAPDRGNFYIMPELFAFEQELAEAVANDSDVWRVKFLRCDGLVEVYDARRSGAMIQTEQEVICRVAKICTEEADRIARRKKSEEIFNNAT